MSEIDLMIANIAEVMENSNESVTQACEKTLRDYSTESFDKPLRMIAWDRS